MNNFGKLFQQNRLIDIAPKHSFDTTLADFEQIINTDFIQMKVE